MARPPRVPVLFSEEKPVIYFLTLCAADRSPVLANEPVFEPILEVVNRMDRWKFWAITVMPDHVHLLMSPPKRETSVGDFSRWFKIGLKRELGSEIQWQEGCFDHLLRGAESGRQKWGYMRENPVRAGLVAKWQDWPFQQGFYE